MKDKIENKMFQAPKDYDLKKVIVDMIMNNNIDYVSILDRGNNETGIDITLKSKPSHIETLENIPEEGIDE